jgi:hypothetical protein
MKQIYIKVPNTDRNSAPKICEQLFLLFKLTLKNVFKFELQFLFPLIHLYCTYITSLLQKNLLLVMGQRATGLLMKRLLGGDGEGIRGKSVRTC